MKLKDFLKQFENEDPETEIVISSARWELDFNCTRTITVQKEFIKSNSLNTGLCNSSWIKESDTDIPVLRIW
jgi:hypothetical protein